MLTGPPRVPRSMMLAADARDAATDRAATPIRMAKAQHRAASRRPSVRRRWRSGGAIRLGRRAFSVATKRPLAWQPSAMGRPKASDGISRRSTLARSCVRQKPWVPGRVRGCGKEDERRRVDPGPGRDPGTRGGDDGALMRLSGPRGVGYRAPEVARQNTPEYQG